MVLIVATLFKFWMAQLKNMSCLIQTHFILHHVRHIHHISSFNKYLEGVTEPAFLVQHERSNRNIYKVTDL